MGQGVRSGCRAYGQGEGGSGQVVGVLAWVEEVSGPGGEGGSPSVDRCTHGCYWFSRSQRHLDGPLRDHQLRWTDVQASH